MTFQSPIYPNFFIGMHDRLTIGGKHFRLVYMSGTTAVLRPVDNEGLTETFEVATLNRLNGAGKITHEVEYFLPPGLRTRGLLPVQDSSRIYDSPAHEIRVDIAFALGKAAEELSDKSRGEYRMKLTDDSIKAHMDEIRDLAMDYLVEEPGDPELAEKLRLYRAGEGKKPRGLKTASRPEAVSPRTIRRYLDCVKRGGKWALADQCSLRRNRASFFTPDENALMMSVVQQEYLRPAGETIAQTALSVRKVFAEKNAERAEQGLSAFRVPSREAVRLAIRKLDRFTVLVAREGQQAALKKMKLVTTGLEVSRPLERVEIDECKIDLITIMAKAGLLSLMSEEDLASMGLDDKKGRWWLVFAVDVRTKIILGMQLTKDPKTSAAIEGLRLCLSQKQHFADKVGAVSFWPFGNPESLWADNGCFKSKLFTSTCANLGISLNRSIAGAPTMRGTIERLFLTASMSLFSRISGYTFSNVVERGAHPSEDRACLNTEDLCHMLVRWIVDIYHNTAHEGLGGRTPLEQWEADHAAGNYPLKALPSRAQRRLAFGVPLQRRLMNDGITVLGLRYHSADLAGAFLTDPDQTVNIRWDHADIGAISVQLGKEWVEASTVYETDKGENPFDGMHAEEWQATARKLRAGDKARKEWDERVVFAALAEIKQLNVTKQLTFNIVDKNWEGKTMAARESVFDGFAIRKGGVHTRAADDGFGRAIEPRAPQATTAPASTDGDATPARRAKRGSTIGTIKE